MRAPISDDELLARLEATLARVEAVAVSTLTLIDSHMRIIDAEVKATDEFREYVLARARLEELQRGQR